jgi:putative iron-only hydrogenase system regulator
MEALERRTGFVGIILENRDCVEEVNHVLSDHAELILARLGLPRFKGGTPVITLVVDATTDEMGALAGRLGKIKGVSVKSALAKQVAQ